MWMITDQKLLPAALRLLHAATTLASATLFDAGSRRGKPLLAAPMRSVVGLQCGATGLRPRNHLNSFRMGAQPLHFLS